jgi:hypothetical protein
MAEGGWTVIGMSKVVGLSALGDNIQGALDQLQLVPLGGSTGPRRDQPGTLIFCSTSVTHICHSEKYWWSQFLRPAIDSNTANSAWICLCKELANLRHMIEN